MDVTPPVAPPPVFGGGFYTNLDAIIEVTDYQRTGYGDNSLIQMTACITNQEDLVVMGPNHQNNYRDGEVLVFLGGTMPPPSKGTEYRNSFGFGDKSYQWLRANGADVSEKDCTSEMAGRTSNPPRREWRGCAFGHRTTLLQTVCLWPRTTCWTGR